MTGGETIILSLGEDREYQTVRDDKNFTVLERRYAVFPQVAGELTVQPTVFEAVVITPSGFSSLQRFRSEAVGLSVLPAVPPPPELAGAAWLPARKVAIEQRWSGDPDEFTARIPQTRTLRVEVEGVVETQIPDLHIFETDSLQQYGDQPELVREGGADGTRAVRTERFAVIAQSAGLLTVPAVEMPWFNVVNRAWEVARIEPPGGYGLAEPRTRCRGRSGSGSRGLTGGRRRHRSAALAGRQRRTAHRVVVDAAAVVAQQPPEARRSAAPPRCASAGKRIAAAVCCASCALPAQLTTPRRARELLLVWGAARFDEDPASLGQLAGLVPTDFAAAIIELERSLYGPDEAGWDGRALREALSQADAVTRTRASQGRRSRVGAALSLTWFACLTALLPWRLGGFGALNGVTGGLVLPMPGVVHRGPGLSRLQGIALLQQFNGNMVRGTDKRHASVPGRAVDDYARLHQPPAGGVDVIDFVGDVAEVAAFIAGLRIPVVSEFELTLLLALRGYEDESESACLEVLAAYLLQPQFVAIKVQRLVQIGNSHHRMQIPHGLPLHRSPPVPVHSLYHPRMSNAARIIFVPGMKPKPPERIHRQVLGRLHAGGG